MIDVKWNSILLYDLMEHTYGLEWCQVEQGEPTYLSYGTIGFSYLCTFFSVWFRSVIYILAYLTFLTDTAFMDWSRSLLITLVKEYRYA